MYGDDSKMNKPHFGNKKTSQRIRMRTETGDVEFIDHQTNHYYNDSSHGPSKNPTAHTHSCKIH